MECTFLLILINGICFSSQIVKAFHLTPLYSFLPRLSFFLSFTSPCSDQSQTRTETNRQRQTKINIRGQNENEYHLFWLISVKSRRRILGESQQQRQQWRLRESPRLRGKLKDKQKPTNDKDKAKPRSWAKAERRNDVVCPQILTWDYFQMRWARGLKFCMVLSYDLTSEIFLK